MSLHQAISKYGIQAKGKLTNIAASGEPEDQLRAPLEGLIADLGELAGYPAHHVRAVGESSIAALKTRPDYAITVGNARIGYVEIKAPGKGANPSKYRGHDKEQWQKLQSLPNLIYTDGNEFSLWRSGEQVGTTVPLIGDVQTAGATLDAPTQLLALFDHFFRWDPDPPKTVKELATTSARLCRLLRDEVTEQMELGSAALTGLAQDWRGLFFPAATNAQFADGYAQAVTFGLLMARAQGISLKAGLGQVARQLGHTNSLIGAALRLLTDDATNQQTLKVSLDTMASVFNVVNWPGISKGNPDAWLYFYEDFLEVYDNDLRKATGSYYTPPQVVDTMVRLVDDVLRTRFAKIDGQVASLLSPQVHVADPAVGTGTYLLGILRRIAATVAADEGPGALPGAINAALKRLVAFEMQLGPFAVAQLRIFAEVFQLTGEVPHVPPRMFVTDTLANPYIEAEHLGSWYETLAESRRQANRVKREEAITVVIGNPPYKEKSKGRGGWVEAGDSARGKAPPLDAWVPPRDWGVGAHVKHLHNLYVYFWRWATWKVFDQDPKGGAGVVCFITVAGFLDGPGFGKMRDYLRRTADFVWVVDASPEGHQPEVNTRIFQGVQQPVCIVLAARVGRPDPDAPALVRYHSLPRDRREAKFAELDALSLEGDAWTHCPTDWVAPFRPAATGTWATYPTLESLFGYNGSGVMPGRTWVIAPDADSLRRRWQVLVAAPADRKEDLFVPHLNKGKLGDRYVTRVVAKGLPGYDPRPRPIAKEVDDWPPPVRYAFRSFDRQWIIPDNRVLNRPNPELWRGHSDHQLYLTALHRTSPSSGPALTFTGLIPDLDHYKGSFGGRVFPLWRDRAGREANLPPKLLGFLAGQYQRAVRAEDLFAYVAGVAAHPGFTSRFQADFQQPGLRIPLTADADLFGAAVDLGRVVIWLHTFGERCVDADAGRPPGPPRMPREWAPQIPVGGAIPGDPAPLPATIEHDASTQRLLVGTGFIANVSAEVWRYEVSGKQVLVQWFSYRRLDRQKPAMGDKRPPSELSKIQPGSWPAEYTTELLNLLRVLGRLVDLEPAQAALLDRIGAAPTISGTELDEAGALVVPDAFRKKLGNPTAGQPSLFGDDPDDEED